MSYTRPPWPLAMSPPPPRKYEEIDLPGGLVVLGDGVCAFNPVGRQGTGRWVRGMWCRGIGPCTVPEDAFSPRAACSAGRAAATVHRLRSIPSLPPLNRGRPFFAATL
jgi:hypothetical protein